MSGVGAPAVRPGTCSAGAYTSGLVGVWGTQHGPTPIRLEATNSGPTHMSGVGAPAVRPRT
eukprot:gene12597-biopygen22990